MNESNMDAFKEWAMPAQLLDSHRGSRASSRSSKLSHSTVSSDGSYTKRDILCGRGGLANQHPGNRVFRRLVKHNKELYKSLPSKRQQNLLIKSILLAVHSQGARFLKEDKKTKVWHEVEYKEAWSKACQALREPERKSSDDSASDCDSASQYSSDRRSSSMSDSMQAPPPPPPPRASLRREYSNMDPPRADRRIFDHPDDLADMEPLSLERGTTHFSFQGVRFSHQDIEDNMPPETLSFRDPERVDNGCGSRSLADCYEPIPVKVTTGEAIPPVPTDFLRMTSSQFFAANLDELLLQREVSEGSDPLQGVTSV